jgi:hypothetical protein
MEKLFHLVVKFTVEDIKLNNFCLELLNSRRSEKLLDFRGQTIQKLGVE